MYPDMFSKVPLSINLDFIRTVYEPLTSVADEFQKQNEGIKLITSKMKYSRDY